MPHLKFDSSRPEQLLEVLKGMHLQEGAELEIEQVENGILLKTLTSSPAEEERQAAFQRIYQAMDSVVKVEPDSFASDAEEEDWIAGEVKAYRKEQRTSPQ